MSPEGEHLSAKVSAELTKTFEDVAKLALQGAAEASDPMLNILDKARNAHSHAALIIDGMMRGLAQLNESMFVGAVIATASLEDRDI